MAGKPPARQINEILASQARTMQVWQAMKNNSLANSLGRQGYDIKSPLHAIHPNGSTFAVALFYNQPTGETVLVAVNDVTHETIATLTMKGGDPSNISNALVTLFAQKIAYTPKEEQNVTPSVSAPSKVMAPPAMLNRLQREVAALEAAHQQRTGEKLESNINTDRDYLAAERALTGYGPLLNSLGTIHAAAVSVGMRARVQTYTSQAHNATRQHIEGKGFISWMENPRSLPTSSLVGINLNTGIPGSKPMMMVAAQARGADIPCMINLNEVPRNPQTLIDVLVRNSHLLDVLEKQDKLEEALQATKDLLASAAHPHGISEKDAQAKLDAVNIQLEMLAYGQTRHSALQPHDVRDGFASGLPHAMPKASARAIA